MNITYETLLFRSYVEYLINIMCQAITTISELDHGLWIVMSFNICLHNAQDPIGLKIS